MTDSQINILSWNRFTTRDFIVAPELLGLSHKFPFNNGQVKIELPSADKLPEEITDESIRESFDSILTIVSYRKEDGRKIPLGISVKSVDVLVCLNKTITLPEEVLTRQPNPYELLSVEQQKQLDEITKRHGDVSYEAFDRWIRTLRWKSGNGSIGRPEIHGFESGWSTYLLNDATKKRFWLSSKPMTLYLHTPIKLSVWHEVEETLNLGQVSPVYIDSMFDGIEQLKVGNLQQSVVYLAVACETFMRARIMQNLPESLTDAVTKFIYEANIRYVIDHLFKDTLDKEQKKLLKSINSRLHELFTARNAILHSGQKEDLTLDNCQKHIEVTKKLIVI